MRALLLLLLLLLPAAGGCRKSTAHDGSTTDAQARAAVANETGAPAGLTMPKGWPLPELQPPAGSLDANLPEPAPEGYGDARMIVDLPFNLGTDQEGRLWRRAFRLPGASLQTVCDFVEARLKPEGYYLYWHEDGRGREYISPDGRYIAQVYYWPDSETFHLQVSVYKTAWRPDSHGPVHSS